MRNFKKLIILTTTGVIALGAVGVVGALNGWYGGGDSIPADTMTRGLVGYWSFDEGYGTTAYDGSDNSNDGTLTNMMTTSTPWTTKGKIGGALDFDGEDDYIDCGNDASLDVTDELTISMWIRWDGEDRAVISKHFKSYEIRMISGITIYWGDGSSYSEVATTGTECTEGQLCHIVAILEANGGNNHYRLYVNGKLERDIYQGTFTDFADQSNNLIIGNRPSSTIYFDGLIDEVRIYNRALTAAEARYHYNHGGPIAHWKLDEGEGQTVYDSTDNDYDGTIYYATSSPWVAGKYGSALSFDGEDDYLNTSSKIQGADVLAQGMTLVAWIKSDDSDGQIVHQNTGTSCLAECVGGIRVVSSKARMAVYNESAYVYATGDTDVDDGSWHHITGLFTEDDYIEIYVDGVLESREYAGGFYDMTVVDTYIGVFGDKKTTYFDGLIDDVRIYNYVRSADEIRLGYNTGLAARLGGRISDGSTPAQCSVNPASCMTEGLVGHWSFDEGAGTTTYDGSDSGNNGTLTNMMTTSTPWTSQGEKVQGNALIFDGLDDYVAIDDPGFNSTESFSIVIRFYLDSSIDSNDTLFGSYYYPQDFDWHYKSTGKEEILIGDASGGGDRIGWNSAGPDLRDKWSHVALVFDAPTLTLDYYVDGAYVYGEAESAIAEFQTGNPYAIGARYRATVDSFLHCVIDDVRIYNRALSAEEVRYLYDRISPSQSRPISAWEDDSSLVGYWMLDEGKGVTAEDSSDNSNTGTFGDGTCVAGSDTCPQWIPGKIGSALDFDGSDDYVDIGKPSELQFTGGQTFTVCGWAYVKETHGSYADWGRLFSADEGGTSPHGYRLWYDKNDETWRFQHASNNGEAQLQGNAVIEDQWQFICGVYDGSNQIIYEDGLETNRGTIGTISADYSGVSSFNIGRREGSANEFNGFIDDVRIYNRVLTAHEIWQQYINSRYVAAHLGGRISNSNSLAADCALNPASCMTEELIGYWPFDEGEGTTAYDGSDKGNDGTLTNMMTTSTPWTARGKIGGALDFDGKDDYVDIGDLSDFIGTGNKISYAAWIKPMVMNKDLYALGCYYGGYKLGTENYGGGMYAWNIYIDGTNHNEYLVSVVTNQWAHLALTYDGTDIGYYLDGVLLKNTTVVGDLSQTNSDWQIGTQGNPNRFFNGAIDDVRIYNRALTAEEVRYLYNRGAPIVHWKLDEGEGTTAYDSTDSDKDGTITGATWSAGKYGSALSFDGTDDYIDVGDTYDGVQTVSFWMKPDNITDIDIIDLDNGTNYIETGSNNNIQAQGFTSPNIYINAHNSSSTALTLNQWHHISITTETAINANDVDIGRVSSSYYDGLIDDVRLYQYARTPEQVLQDYNAGKAARFK